MVTYEYVCEYCKYEWEEEQKIIDEPIIICPNCEHGSAKRLVSGGQGFKLSGDRWAKDGYSG